MLYEEKRQKVGLAVRDVSKMTSKRSETILDTRKPELKGVLIREIESILKQFEDEKKIKVISKISNASFEDLFPEDEPKDGVTFTLKMLDAKFFESFLPTKPFVNPIVELQNKMTGMTAKERAEVDALKNSSNNKIPENYFFIEYKADRNIRLNGKILMYKPQLRDSEVLFKYLYDNPDVEFTKKELEEKLEIAITDKFQKITSRWGFRAGFRDAFFDIHEDTINPEKSTIKFKNHIIL